LRQLLLILTALSLLAACAAPTASPAPTPAATTGSEATPTATAPAETARPGEPTLAPPLKIVFVTAGGAQAEAAQAVVQRAAQEFGWSFERMPEASPGAINTVAQAGADVIVIDGLAAQDRALSVAADYPSAYFIGLHPSAGGDLPANMITLGGVDSRHDQAGFLAGMAAGFASETQKVAVVGDPNTAEGRKYRNGFLHGVRYACPKCRVDFIDLGATEGTLSEEAVRYALFGFDVIFAAAGQPGDEALRAAAEKGAFVIGSRSDMYTTLFGNGAAPGAERVLTSVFLDEAQALLAALAAFRIGHPFTGAQPLSAANGAVSLAPIRGNRLSLPDQQDIAAALARLADGSLETGIDPVTGEEK
jgi:basic membrane lipoprotein Med (substrate-binding protein (PBP1-ABC) superfamily)